MLPEQRSCTDVLQLPSENVASPQLVTFLPVWVEGKYVFACASEKTDQVCWNNEKPAVFKESISVYLAPNLPDQHKGQKLKAACREQSAGEVREDSAIR